MRIAEPGTLAAVRRGRVGGGAALLGIAALLAVGSASARPGAARAGTSGSPLAGPAAAALLSAPPRQEARRYELTGPAVRISDLAGHVSVVAGDGDRVVVLVRRQGRDAGRLRVEADERAGTLTVRVPGDRLVYPELGLHSRVTLRVGEDGLFGDGRRMTVAGSGSGPEARADLTVQVPRGLRAAIEVGAGPVEARGVPAELDLRTGSGRVHADGTGGALRVRTGSGNVEAAATAGRLEVHTGSGDVEVRDASAAVELRTGSGDIRVRGRVGGSFRAHTGSGSVTAGDIKGEAVDVRTGSGGIRIAAVAADDVTLHTGSGSVRADLARAPSGLSVDTGSGSVELALPRDASADLDIRTGSGGIRTEAPLQLLWNERSHVRGRLGSGGPDYVIRTGSGSVSLKAADSGGG